jgi:hypothetical protein
MSGRQNREIIGHEHGDMRLKQATYSVSLIDFQGLLMILDHVGRGCCTETREATLRGDSKARHKAV